MYRVALHVHLPMSLIVCRQDVYGVLRTLEGLDVFADLVSSTEIGPWYQAMKEQVQRHNGRL